MLKYLERLRDILMSNKSKDLFQTRIDQQMKAERDRNHKSNKKKPKNIIETLMSIIIGGSVIFGLLRILVMLF